MLIEEKRAKKLPTLTSLFFKLPFYDQTLFQTLIQSSDCVYDKVSSEFEFPVNHLGFLIDALSRYGDVSVKVMSEESPTHIINCNDYEFKRKIYNHQKKGIEYGINRDDGWMLLDEQGLGKSVQMIYLAEALKKREHLEHCLIICGVNSLKYNWESEIHKFSDLSCMILGKKVSRNGKVSFTTVADRCKQLKAPIDEFFVITNIETLQSKEFAEAFNKSKNKFDMIVFDEIHRCKDPQSKSAKTLMKLKAKRCIGLTGTLIMNVPENSFIPLKWTGNTNSTFSQFKHMYNMYGGFGNVQVIGHKNLELLRELIDSCSLRRLKSQVLDLPEKVYSTEYVELLPKQRELYNEVEQGVLLELNKLDHKPTIIEEITINMRLRQISASPSILSTEVTQSAKLDRLEELAEDIVGQGDKLVVFCSFKGTAYEAYERLSKYSPVLSTGDTDDATLEVNKSRFQNDDDCKIFIGTWQKCGTGITLTSANYLIFVDTPWTDADFKQASDRIHRIGQSKTSFIITLISVDTYDTRVQEILENKECLSSYLMGERDGYGKDFQKSF